MIHPLPESHFVIGADQQQYETEMKTNYLNRQGEGFAKVNLDSRFFANNFDHTNPNGATNYNSAYKTQMKAPIIEKNA